MLPGPENALQRFDGVVLAELLGVFDQHLRNADYGVQWCSKFMAHIGEEPALGLGSGLRLFLGGEQLGFGPGAFDDPSELGADLRDDLHERFVGLNGLVGEEFQDSGNLPADQDREGGTGSDADLHGRLRAGKVRVLRDVHDPCGLSAG